jgi:hypothetical protein
MSYENPLTMTYVYPALGFGAASSASSIKPPLRMVQGNIRDIHVGVTVLFTQVTTAAHVLLGYSGDTDYYADLTMGAAAASAGYNLRDAGSIYRKIDILNDTVPGVLTAVLVSFVAATGGSPAGTGTTAILIDWF